MTTNNLVNLRAFVAMIFFATKAQRHQVNTKYFVMEVIGLLKSIHVFRKSH